VGAFARRRGPATAAGQAQEPFQETLSYAAFSAARGRTAKISGCKLLILRAIEKLWEAGCAERSVRSKAALPNDFWVAGAE